MEKEKNRIKKGICAFTALIGFFFAFFVKTEWDLSSQKNILWSGKYVLVLLLICIFSGAAFAIAYILIKKFDLKIICKKNRLPGKAVFFCSTGIALLSYMPFYLAFYPGIMAYDVPIQLGQIVNNAYNAHHPLFHTLFIKGCLTVGEALFHSANAGMGLCTFMQMLMLSVAIGFLLYTLNEMEISLFLKIFTQILFSVIFLNGFIAVSITKDTIFTAFYLIFLCSLYLILSGKKAAGYKITLCTGAVGLSLFRNNGKFALMALLLVILIAVLINKDKKVYLKLSAFVFVSLIFALVLDKSVFKLTNATEGDKREMLSVPIQQIARVMVYEEQYLTEEEKALVDEFIFYRAYDNYNPVISDPVKGLTNTSVIRYQPKRFLKVYLSLLKKYPGDYVNAALALIGGYVSPLDQSFRVMTVGDEINKTRNYIQHTNTATEYAYMVYDDPVLPGLKKALDDFAEKDLFMKPVLCILYIPGIYIWLMLFKFIVVFDRKEYKLIIPMLFSFAFFGTLLLGPTMNLRYIYPIMVSLPLLFIGQRTYVRS